MTTFTFTFDYKENKMDIGVNINAPSKAKIVPPSTPTSILPYIVIISIALVSILVVSIAGFCGYKLWIKIAKQRKQEKMLLYQDQIEGNCKGVFAEKVREDRASVNEINFEEAVTETEDISTGLIEQKERNYSIE